MNAVKSASSVRRAVLDAVATQKAVNPFLSLTISQVWEHCKECFPGLTRPDFRRTLVRMHNTEILLGAWTLAAALMPGQDREHAFEHLHEVKYYVHSI